MDSEKMQNDLIQTYTEMGDTFQTMSKLCKENVSILKNPIRFMIESDKIIKNNDLLCLHIVVINNYMTATAERYKDMEEE